MQGENIEFDIVNYLNKLSSSTIIINISNRNLTYIPDLSRFKRLQILNCQNNKLTLLPPFNATLESVNCSRNKLTSLPPFNERLLDIDCSQNCLRKLPKLNKNLVYLDCCLNHLNYLPELKHLNKLKDLCIYSNNLRALPYLPEQLNYFDANGNEIFNILQLIFSINLLSSSKIFYKKKDIIKINKWVHFREYYFLSKYKKKFISWMIKSREKKIKQQFHPSVLEEFLKTVPDDDDGEALDNFLNAWI